MLFFTFVVRNLYDDSNLKIKSWTLINPGAFEDDDVTHVEGEVDPIRDLEIINEELRLKDEEQLMAAIDKLGKTVLRGDKKDKNEYVRMHKNISIHLLILNGISRISYANSNNYWLMIESICVLVNGMPMR